MRVLPYFAAVATASALFACDKQTDTLASTTDLEAVQAGFVTGKPAQAHALLPQASVKPILTVGEAKEHLARSGFPVRVPHPA